MLRDIIDKRNAFCVLSDKLIKSAVILCIFLSVLLQIYRRRDTDRREILHGLKIHD